MLGGLDHVRIAVPDLAAAIAACERLGFTVTPPRRDAAGTPSAHLMLARDHVELIERPGPSLAGLVLSCDDATRTAQAWRRAGLFTTPTTARRRELAGNAPAVAFAEVAPEPAEVEGLPIMAAAHLTPEALRRPDWLRHANGADRIAALTVVVAAPAACAAPLEKLVGAAALTWTDRILAVRLGHVALLLVDNADVELLHAAVPASPPPAVAALSFGVGDPAQVARNLAARGVAHRRRPDGSVGVDLDPALGCLLEFKATA